MGRGLSARNVRDPLGDGWSEDGDTPTQLPICIKQSHTRISSFMNSLKFAYPDIPVMNRIAVVLKRDGKFACMRFIGGAFFPGGRACQLCIILDPDSIV